MAVVNYDYSKLRGRIIEIFGTQRDFAEALGVSPQTITCKMKGYVEWSQEDIAKVIEILNIDPREIHVYFFTKKDEKISTLAGDDE